MVMLQIGQQLLFSPFVIGISAPDFQFNYHLFPMKIYDYVCTLHVTGSGLNIIISRAVNDRAKVKQEIAPAILFLKFIGAVPI